MLTEREAAVWARLRQRIRVEGVEEGTAVLPSAPCWSWRGAWDRRWKVGKVWAWGRQRNVHRLLYELLLGDVPDGHTLTRLDLCGGDRCVNPTHYLAVPRWLEQASKPTTITARNLARTHCGRGHALDEQNVGYCWRGGDRTTRYCKACRRERGRGRKQRVEGRPTR